MTVLIVEDDGMILEGLKYSLMQEGYEVLTAVDVAGAKALCRRKSSRISVCWMLCFQMEMDLRFVRKSG